MADSDESSQFLLQPLASTATTTPTTPTTTQQEQSRHGDHDDTHAASDTNETQEETPSPASGESHSHSDNNDVPTKQTGLVIRDAAPPSSPDIDGSHSRHHRHADNIFLTWSLELALVLVAAGLLAAMISILSTYSGNEVPNWNGGNDNSGGITLNALMAVLSTVFRAILAFVALQVLAQLKWDWVSTRFRPMGDVQRFDDASRGAWGSLRLLPVVALREPLAVAAVIVVVASLAIGPVTQQTMQTYYCLRVTAGRPAAITVASSVPEGSIYYTQRSVAYALNVGVQSAMQDAMVNPDNDTNIAALFACPSGNCTFASYADEPGQPEDEKVSHASLGMCSRCEDVYDLVELLPNKATLRLEASTSGLPSNETLSLKITPGIPGTSNLSYLAARVTGSMAWAQEAVPRDFINAARWSAANFTVLAFSQDRCDTLPNGTVSCSLYANPVETLRVAWGEETDYVAATCILYPCIKYYAGIVRDGALSERLVRSMPARPQTPRPLRYGGENSLSVPWGGVQVPCQVNGTLYTSSNMSSASEQLPPSARETVNVHSKDWADEDLDAPAGYVNVTAPRECTVSFMSGLLDALYRQLGESGFDAECAPQGHQMEVVTCTSEWGGSSMPMAGLLHPRSTSLETIRENIASLAMRITTEMRRAGDEATVAVEGKAWENRVCIRVVWGWFALTATLLVLCVVLLGWVILGHLWTGNGGVVWKSSMLPLLLKDHVSALETMSLRELDTAAEKLEVRLQKPE